MAFATNFAFWLLSIWSQGATGTLQSILKHLAINEQFTSFAKGTVELQSLVFFVTLIGLFLFLTNRSLESRAWRS
jgi:ABC-2 type transport system permease protein